MWEEDFKSPVSTIPPTGPDLYYTVTGSAAGATTACYLLDMHTLLLLLWFSCVSPARRAARRDPGFPEARRGDELFARRGEDPDKLDEAIDIWQAALVTHPQSPSLLMRLSRAWTMRGMRDPERRPSGLVVGREMGLRCMTSEPSVSVLVDTFGRLELRAIEQSSRTACLAWTSMAWSRWLLEHDVAGAAIDLSRVEALARRAVALRPDALQGRPLHALGVALSLPPEPLEPDLDAAEENLLQARELAPDRWQIEVDLAVLVYGPQPDRHDEFRAILGEVVAREPGTKPGAYENITAQQQARQALDEGPQPRWAL